MQLAIVGRQRDGGFQMGQRIGVTAGASAPEVLVLDVISALQALGAKRVNQLSGIDENVVFPLPKGLSVSD